MAACFSDFGLLKHLSRLAWRAFRELLAPGYRDIASNTQ
jgi:hypothetical protein